MQFIYKVPGYLLLLFGGFCLSWGGFIVRSFEEASVWQILFLRSFFFLIFLSFFLIVIYKKNTIQIIDSLLADKPIKSKSFRNRTNSAPEKNRPILNGGKNA